MNAPTMIQQPKEKFRVLDLLQLDLRENDALPPEAAQFLRGELPWL